VNNKGVLFTIDGIIALAIIILASVIISTNQLSDDNNSLAEFAIAEKINDILVTAQLLQINSNLELVNNYNQLFKSQAGYVKLNSTITKIGAANKNQRLISNSIKYINKSGQEIYIEVGVYY
jgi:hypothetical protein